MIIQKELNKSEVLAIVGVELDEEIPYTVTINSEIQISIIGELDDEHSRSDHNETDVQPTA